MHLAGGRLGRFIYQLMKNDSIALEVATSVLYLKKGFPRPDEQQLAAALIATKKVLTTPRPIPISNIATPVGPLSLEMMGEQVRRTCREVFGKSQITEADLHKPYAPSVRANYVDSRSKFGTFGTLMDLGLIKDRSDGRFLEDAFELEDSEERMEEEDVVRTRLSPVFKERVKALYTETYEAARQLAKDEGADVKLVALPESLKIRVISKGPPLTYFVLKPVQKFLHRIMRKHPMFKLIGETVSEKLLNDCFASLPGYFHSLDYSSATDFLNPWISEQAVEEICASVGMPDDLRILFLRALTGHTVEGERQVWGQLMGSIVSFIILCLVNAAVIQFSLEIVEKREIPLDKCPALVNGDDGAVRSVMEFLPVWKDVASLCGLEPSQGKVYTSDHYLNINSTSFQLVDGLLRHVPYVNMGLLAGMKRAGAGKVGKGELFDSAEFQFSSLGARHHQLLESCPPALQKAVHRSFIHHHWSTLSTIGLPWFVPESCGGVGLKPFRVWNLAEDIDEVSWSYYEDPVTGARWGPSDMDSDGVSLLRSRDRQVIPVRRIDPSQPVQVRNIWYRRCGFRIPSGPTVNFDHQMSDEDIGFLDVSCYYLLPSLVAVASESTALVVLKANERAWGRLRKILSSESVD